jgi:hypothetical protein
MPEIDSAFGAKTFPVVLTDAKGFLVAVLKTAHELIRVARSNCALAKSHQQICLGRAPRLSKPFAAIQSPLELMAVAAWSVTKSASGLVASRPST